jgi:hypothetical protein
VQLRLLLKIKLSNLVGKKKGRNATCCDCAALSTAAIGQSSAPGSSPRVSQCRMRMASHRMVESGLYCGLNYRQEQQQQQQPPDLSPRSFESWNCTSRSFRTWDPRSPSSHLPEQAWARIEEPAVPRMLSQNFALIQRNFVKKMQRIRDSILKWIITRIRRRMVPSILPKQRPWQRQR